MKKEYRTAVDIWIVSILIGAPSLVLALGVWAYQRNHVAGLLQMALGVMIAVLISLFSRPCGYALEGEVLRIRCGLLEEALPLAKIRGLELNTSLWSAPGLSSRRVKILLKDGDHRLVSPEDREGFMRDLQEALVSSGGS
jgi:hypothetical protein